jgi:hypothetical protein
MSSPRRHARMADVLAILLFVGKGPRSYFASFDAKEKGGQRVLPFRAATVVVSRSAVTKEGNSSGHLRQS